MEPNVQQSVEIDFAAMDNLITNNQCRISVLAKELSVSEKDLKQAFVEHYGNRIIFKRGRNGGVFWNVVPHTNV